MTLLTREQMLAADDLHREFVEVPGLGGGVWVRTLTGTERDYDRRRGPGRQFYGSTPWRKYRAWFLAVNPLCIECEAAGRTVPTTEVDHVKKRKDHPELAFNPDNCRALCKGCHSRNTQQG